MSAPALAAPAPVGSAETAPSADPDQRFHAFLVDRLLVWGTDAAVAVVAWRALVAEGSVLTGVVVVLGAVVVTGGALAAVQATTGVTPGKALLGLRLQRADGGGPIGLRAGLLRGLVLGLGGLPTAGFGVASLAWTALVDPEGRRRGWHDRLAGSVVVDVRPTPEAVVEPPPPQPMVNLTTLRMTPTASQPATPGRRRAEPVPPPGEVPAAAAPGRWRITFDTGETLVVEGAALVGRRPEPGPEEQVRHLVPLRSDDLSVSQTHAQVHVAADGALVVTDRGSTNGTVLLRQGASRALAPGRATTLLAGDRVRLGGRLMSVAREA